MNFLEEYPQEFYSENNSIQISCRTSSHVLLNNHPHSITSGSNELGWDMSKRLLLSTASVAILAATSLQVSAADLPTKAPVAPVVATLWTGWYVGGHAGYGWGRFDFSSFPTLQQHKGNGPVSGLQLGYNWRSGNIVWGLEGDVSATNLTTGDGDYVRANVD
jgi:opacity protein-like surface antigen